MKTTTVTDFRKKMKSHLHELEMDQDILILSGAKRKDFVVLTLDQYNAMEETAHLLSTPANATHLLESIKQDRAGKSERKVLKSAPAKKAIVKKTKIKA
ncbi:MAG: type II toxin-antitoxin system Phd/YefM family antitoxin [Cyclobacteriaceae bacterium]|jgi:antitoxin YefM|nr:type II toxin-antitoxin system Phd/YefM family antitoxin [Flammeovirgaceae bacterium]